MLFEEAFEGALTKFGSLDAYLANGRFVPDVCAMIAEEIRSDIDVALTLADEAERFALWLRKTVGKANDGAWRKGAGSAMGTKSRGRSATTRCRGRASAHIRSGSRRCSATTSASSQPPRRPTALVPARSVHASAPPRARAGGDATANAAARGVDQVRRHVLW